MDPVSWGLTLLYAKGKACVAFLMLRRSQEVGIVRIKLVIGMDHSQSREWVNWLNEDLAEVCCEMGKWDLI